MSAMEIDGYPPLSSARNGDPNSRPQSSHQPQRSRRGPSHSPADSPAHPYAHPSRNPPSGSQSQRGPPPSQPHFQGGDPRANGGNSGGRGGRGGGRGGRGGGFGGGGGGRGGQGGGTADVFIGEPVGAPVPLPFHPTPAPAPLPPKQTAGALPFDHAAFPLKFTDLGLIQPLMRAVAQQSYDVPTPIQQKAIPFILSGRDLLGCAQTGTGKTAAFSLPILQNLTQHPSGVPPNARRPIRCLVLTPTRELALQIGESFSSYGAFLPHTHTVIVGGVGQNPQEKALERGVDIVVACPGRLLDLMQQGLVDLRSLSIFVLDEADRMLDMGFIHDIRKVVARLPAKRQNTVLQRYDAARHQGAGGHAADHSRLRGGGARVLHRRAHRAVGLLPPRRTQDRPPPPPVPVTRLGQGAHLHPH